MTNVIALTTDRDLDWLRERVKRLTDEQFARHLEALRTAGLISYQSSTVRVGRS